MPAKMQKVAWGREHHEQFAIDAVASASQELPATWACTTAAVYATVRANRSIAQARSHLASIGGHDGPRTRKLWAAVEKQQRAVDIASDRLARCVLKCQPEGGTAGLGRARKRRR